MEIKNSPPTRGWNFRRPMYYWQPNKTSGEKLLKLKYPGFCFTRRTFLSCREASLCFRLYLYDTRLSEFNTWLIPSLGWVQLGSLILKGTTIFQLLNARRVMKVTCLISSTKKLNKDLLGPVWYLQLLFITIMKRCRAYVPTFTFIEHIFRNHVLKKRKESSNLKKCAPTMRSWELVFSPTKLRSMVDVFVAKMQWAGQAFSISLNIFCFKGTLSITACKRGQTEH